jgi:hypothetical protein
MTTMIGVVDTDSPIGRSRARLPLVRGLVVALVLGTLAGCSLLAPGGPGPLVSVEARGGMCVGGECRTVTTILRNGSLSVENGGEVRTATLDAAILSTLTAAVDAADYAAITAVPFTGTCPTAFDGPELVYTFHPAGRAAVTFSACQVAVDDSQPLFRALDAALQAGIP